uniref:sulfotransferase domain-containing protein n=1 Tax=Paractinoplanes polyasparticus TaxID=2856853 RepID=UPI0027E0F3AD|nr:sulfotransferase domain-containing protein [Actinoplanes polyasparticus]
MNNNLAHLKHYVDTSYDSHRWKALPLRPTDIVVATPVKSGTTWLQMICALLVFQGSEFPAPLGVLSPWLDQTVDPVSDVVNRLEAQQHRRIIKSHTPLDGIPTRPGMTIVAGSRHPLDAALSFYHQIRNVDFQAVALRLGLPATFDPTPVEDEHEWLADWINDETRPASNQSLLGLLRQNRLAWDRRNDPGIVLVHYADLAADLEGQMRRIAGRLNINVPETRWPDLVEAASFQRMADRADDLLPTGQFKSSRAFFRGGRSGDGARLLSAAETDRYYARAAGELNNELLGWLHRP